MWRSITFLIISLVLIGYPTLGQGQDSAGVRQRPQQLDSVRLDTMHDGPRYEFTGHEDPTLLAAAFSHVAKLGRQAAGETPAAYCVALGREDAPVPSAVMSLLSNSDPPYRPRTFCKIDMNAQRAVEDTSSGKLAWILGISALPATSESSFKVYLSYYVGPLWAEGWVCSANRDSRGWSFHDCVERWIA